MHKVGDGFQNNSNSSDILNAIDKNYGSEIYGLYTIGVSKDNNGLFNGITGFSPFSVVNADGFILPVNIINLKAYRSGPSVIVDWTSLNEVNVDHYEVERSATANQFSTLGSVKRKNTGGSIDYRYTDLQPLNGNNFYRIKAVDQDGMVTYSHVVSLNISGTAKPAITVYPNPVTTGSLNVMLNNLEKSRYSFFLRCPKYRSAV